MFEESQFINLLGLTEQSDIDYMSLMLDVLEEMIKGAGVDINTDDQSADHNIFLERGVEYDEIVVPYFYEITSIKKKSHTDSAYEEAISTDNYRLCTHILDPHPVYNIELDKSICYPYYLQIDGKKGFARSTPKSIIYAASSMLAKLLAARKLNAQLIKTGGGIKKTKMRNVEVEFQNSNMQSTQSIIEDDSEFNSIISKYKQITL